MTTTTRTTSMVAIAATAFVGVGLLSACGAGTATEAQTSTTASASREAKSKSFGEKEIRLSLVNQTGQNLDINTLDVTNKTDHQRNAVERNTTRATTSGSQTLSPSETALSTAESVGFAVSGSNANSIDTLAAQNPVVTEPYVVYKPTAPNKGAWELRQRFSEGAIFNWTSPSTGHKYEIKRSPDSNYKEFTITVR